MESGRQGVIGNGHTSRVWKGDGHAFSAGQYLKHGYWPFLLISDCRFKKFEI
jgi:hypothetical protein